MRLKGFKLNGWLFLGILLQGALSQGELPKYCSDATVKSVQAPIEKGSDQTFEFFYQKIIKHQGPSKPVFILIPGGPGSTSMTEPMDPNFANYDVITGEPIDDTEMYWGLPQGSNMILTDPRSRGCNGNNDLSPSTYKTDNIVSDLVTLIQKEQLNNYVIVGLSYGTVVATRLVYEIESRKMPGPKALLLTGVMGKSFEVDIYGQAIGDVWKQFYAQLSKDIQKVLPPDIMAIKDSEDFTFPFGLETQTWINFIQSGLMYGRSYLYMDEDQNFLRRSLNKLKYLNDYRNGYLAAELKTLVARYAKLSSPEVQKTSFYSQIWFSEIMNDPGRAHLTTNPIALYDSTDYQIETPTIYLHGQWDTIVKIDLARYQYENQKNKNNNYFIVGVDGAHDMLPALHGCKAEFWQEVLNKAKKSRLKEILESCQTDLELVE